MPGHPAAATRANGAELGRPADAQQRDRLGCATATVWSPVSPSFSSPPRAVLPPSCDAAVLDTIKMTHDDTSNNPAAEHSSSTTSFSSNNSAPFKSERADDPASMMAASPFELDRDMMGMLTNNWSLNNGPPRAPVANWGFEPTAAEAQALYDSDALMPAPASHQQTLPGSMMPTSAGMAPMMNLGNNMPVQAPAVDPFTGMDNGFAMPYQDCAALPVNDFPLYDPASTGMYMPASNAGMSHYAASNNQLGDGTAPFFANPAMMSATPSSAFQGGMGNSNGSTLFNDVAQPPAAALAAINGFSLPDMAAMNDESDANSDWNGSSSGFSNVSSSPLPSGVGTPSSVAVTTPLASPTTGGRVPGKDAPKKPKRIRRLCSVAGCGKRARSQDLCIAHGGGRRCMVEGCEKSSQGGNMCIKHGGGKRCKHPGCDKAAQTNSLCKAHGGGPRCQFVGCTKSSQGGGFCRAHGGGKRCAAEGCNKGTQRGDFCALHGGSRFCEVEGCMRNDRGGGFCAHHGGGKRCSIANCNRSCRRNGLCSTHLRLLGQGAGGKGAASVPTSAPASVPVTSAAPTTFPVTIAGVTSV